MRQEYTLRGVPGGFAGQNIRSVSQLAWRPNKLIVLNNTSNPVYVRRGSPDVPDATNADYVIPAASNGIPGNVALPVNVREFGFFLPLTPALTDATQVATIILEG